MYEMRTVARIIHLAGGLEALAANPITIEIVGENPLGMDRHPLRIEHLGVGLHGAPTQLVSVAWLKTVGDETVGFPELIFEILPSADRKIGWRSGTWLPVSFHNVPYGYEQVAVTERRGKVDVNRPMADELRKFARHWDGWIKTNGYLAAAQFVADEEMKERTLLNPTATQRQALTRDTRGRWLASA